MQMRVNRYQPVDMARQRLCKHTGGDRLPGPETTVLTHIAQIGCDQPHRACTELPKGLEKEQMGKVPGVRIGQVSQHNTSRTTDRSIDTQVGLTIGEPAKFQTPLLQATADRTAFPVRDGFPGKTEPLARYSCPQSPLRLKGKNWGLTRYIGQGIIPFAGAFTQQLVEWIPNCYGIAHVGK